MVMPAKKLEAKYTFWGFYFNPLCLLYWRVNSKLSFETHYLPFQTNIAVDELPPPWPFPTLTHSQVICETNINTFINRAGNNEAAAVCILI